ncbi:MAG: sugar ABC transporter substrate-binding protein [Synergistaceae bacterium]|jgi:ribose transport system substrate-binding protein|nr:sugar ABC transporter substrate-binding protein [Synergistaceae bacterium]
MKRILVAALTAFVLVACCTAVFAADRKPVVGLVMKSLANEFFKTMEEGAQKFAKEDGTFELIAVGMNSETDIDTQINAVENFISQKVDVIVLAPADSVGLVPSVKKAVDAGIIVVNFDVTLDKQALKDNGLPEDFLFVGPDNEEGSYLVGKFLGGKLGKGAKVIIIEGNPGADNAKQRKDGFDKAIAETGMTTLESTTAHWETEEANTVVTNLLTKYPDVQGVLCANDSMALGAARAIEAAGKVGKIELVGFDNIGACQELIKEGKMLATVDQFGPELAASGIKAGLAILRKEAGAQTSGWYKTDVKVVAAADLK